MIADGEPKVGDLTSPPPRVLLLIRLVLMLYYTNEMMNRWRKEAKRSVKAKRGRFRREVTQFPKMPDCCLSKKSSAHAGGSRRRA